MPLCFVALLTGCANSPPQIKLQLKTVDVPVGLRHCIASPRVPKGQYTQRDVASYVVKLKASRDDCAYKLKSVDELLIENEQAVAEFNAKEPAR